MTAAVTATIIAVIAWAAVDTGDSGPPRAAPGGACLPSRGRCCPAPSRCRIRLRPGRS